MVLCTLTSWTVSFLILFQCRPINLAWDKSVPGRCLDVNACWFLIVAISVIVDLSLMAIIFPQVARLHIAKHRKIALLVIVNLGWLAIAAGIIRSITLWRGVSGPDPTWISPDISVWTGAEMATYMTCAAVPSTKPILSIIFMRWKRLKTGLSSTLCSKEDESVA